jgi:hypothetical protein
VSPFVFLAQAGKRYTRRLVGIPTKFLLLSGNVVLKRWDRNEPTSFVEVLPGQHEIELDSRVSLAPPSLRPKRSACGVAGLRSGSGQRDLMC